MNEIQEYIIKCYAKTLFNLLLSKDLPKSKKLESLNKKHLNDINESIKIDYLYFPKDKGLSSIGKDLILVKSLILSSSKLHNYYKNPLISSNKKLKILIENLAGLSLTTNSFLKIVSEQDHLSYLPEIADYYNYLLLKSQNVSFINIVFGSSFNEEISKLLIKVIQKISNSKKLLLSCSYNSQLLGGLIIEYNSTIFDLTISTKINKLF
jgi:F-type H+-transporting ATPase subunit delta